MVRNVRAWGLLALSLAVLSVPSRADQKNDSNGLFDGSGKSSLEVPSTKDVRAASAQASKAPQAEAFVPAKQSGHDLYYFGKDAVAYARKKFGIREQSRNNKGMVFDADVPEDIQKQMRADMAFIGGIKGGAGTPLHQKIFGAVDGATYVNFFETRVTGIGMNDCGSGKAVACVIPFQDPSKMWLTQNFVKFDHPAIARMMIVFHESRHTESQNGNWMHATCPDPWNDAEGKPVVSVWTGATLAGEAACDSTPLGSYGSSTIMLKNISKSCTNCTDKVRMDAGFYSDNQLGRITDEGAHQEMVEDFKK
ncbi:MAG: hypothetical protein ACHQ49_03735 [Elusimicrobiota bacterium]